MSTPPLLTLDIGASKIACAIGVPHTQTNGFELLGTSLVAFPTLTETEWPDPLVLAQTIEQTVEATGVSADFVAAHVVFTHGQLRSEQVQVSIPVADEPIAVRTHDLERLQAAALHQVLGVDREALLIERLGCSGNGFERVRDPRGLPATRLHGLFHILTVPMAVRRLLTQALEACGLEASDLAYALPSAFAAVSEEGMEHKRVLLVDAGGVTTDMGLFADGMLHSAATVRWGGALLAQAIARTCQTTLDQALSWSLEGAACRKIDAVTVIQEGWQRLEAPLKQVLAGRPAPDAVVICGRAGLVDGFAEWLERATGAPTTVGRHPRAHRFGDLSRQVGLSTALGRLELACARPADERRSPHLLGRVIRRTQSVLAEYF